MNKHPSIIKIINTDYIAFIAFLFPVVIWIFYFVLMLTNKINLTDWELLSVYAVITFIAVITLVWRIHLFNTIFDDGIEALATISNVSFFRDRGRIEYIYLFQGQKYSSGIAVRKTKHTSAVNSGQPAVIMIDRNLPKRAIIRDLFL